MRIYLSLLFIAIFASLHAQTTVCYNYDAAGNRIQKGSSVCAGFTGEDPEKNKKGKEPLVFERSSESNSSEAEAFIEGKIVPNPNNGQFELRLDQAPDEESWLELYDSEGSLLSRQKAAGLYVSFDMGGKASGNYFLYLRSTSRQAGNWIVVKQ